ncbi:MAG TPA: SHOCT domain-containing protein [Anaerolineae bacterium]|nr:SHOCT domain-containing protein [Anaerolineae bacterium]
MSRVLRAVLVVLGVLLVIGLIVGGFALSRGGYGMFGDRFYPMFGFGMMSGVGFILPVLFWVLIIGLGVWLISGWSRGSHMDRPANSSQPESALDILKKRYARGEITKEQFDAMKHDLDS